ncbi:RDD family protein [Lysobacter sp. H23M47]|uniref:RDD family protein n=1 Tax=Lysobacter sp. H23M47 TaxID=2781024 RepID=UPI001880BA8A|nr:RDD family protein [Lysobacter sp. H23M47]QOW24383.1 RDD family protein [Lysobacter sp. H23M47]
MTASIGPAGLWQRSAAWTLDGAVLGPMSLLLAWPLLSSRVALFSQRMNDLLEATGHAMGRAIIDGVPLPALGMTVMQDPSIRASTAGLEHALWALGWPSLATLFVVSAIYHTAFEAGAWQATPGQRLLGLQVADARRQRLRPGRVLLRHVAGVASWLTLNIGHLMAAVPPLHQTLHDRLSATRVWAARPGMPAWAVAWLALVGTVSLALGAWWMASAMATMQLALERSLQ